MSTVETNLIHTGDAFDVLPTLPENSVHAVVTDPPYGLAFMGRDWDDFEPREYQEWCMEWAREVRRVLRPGGHLLAFSGNRTHHRLFTGVEDAGFEIRDTVTWHYGNGFPKNTDTLLKPASEFVVLARAPFDGTAKDCHKDYGTAYLSINECRIDGEVPEFEDYAGDAENAYSDGLHGSKQVGMKEGRYPSNVVFSEDTARELDRKGPHRTETDRTIGGGGERDSDFHMADEETQAYPGSGGPSRYFYTSKASKSERTQNGSIQNTHPTVKPLDLMEWLTKLVTREDQIVLDPFCGSGTTCKAAKNLGREFVGIEQQAEYADVARARVGLTPRDPGHVRGDDNQAGLGAFE